MINTSLYILLFTEVVLYMLQFSLSAPTLFNKWPVVYFQKF